MRGSPVGHVLDQRRAGAGARAFGGPLRDRMHRQEIVAVDAHARDAVARAARREGLALRRPRWPWKVEIAHWLLTTLRITGALYT